MLCGRLIACANKAGGWGYASGKASRLEPTCWALLALGGVDDPSTARVIAPHVEFVARTQRTSGWLVEDERLPVNIAFNALTSVVWLHRPAFATEEMRRKLILSLIRSKGARGAQAQHVVGLNSTLQGWSWVEATFSWVEPTCWGLLALKKARRTGLAFAGDAARIDEAERLLIDRCCRAGGWNYGNPDVMGKDLLPYVAVTALALIALQARREDSAVARSVDWLEAHWRDEPSAMATGLALMSLQVHGRPTGALENWLRGHASGFDVAANVHGAALMSCALSPHASAVQALTLS